MSRPEAARDFIDIHLPFDLKAVCDLNTLKLEPTSFIEDDLRPYFSDLLWSLKTTHGEGYVHLLIEHQSSPDVHMGFRLMRYAIAAMQQHLETGHKKLPLVIPVLYYAGKRSPYPWSVNWLEEFDDPALAKRLYGGAFPLVDVTVIPDEEISQHRHIAALTWLQKHVRSLEKMQNLEPLVLLLKSEYTDGQTLTILVNYFIHTGERAEPKTFLRTLANRLPQHKETLMTIAEYLVQEGREEGRAEGRQEGRQEGREKGLQEGRQEEAMRIAAQLITMGMSPETVKQVTSLTDDVLEQISQ